jgi:hypothetical protein
LRIVPWLAAVLLAAASASAQPASDPVRVIDVPYIQQSEALCGGAAAAMVMRFWGATGIYAESFASLVDDAARGIRGDVLLADLRSRGWDARSFGGDGDLVRSRLEAGQPVIALIEDRPGFFHFVVVVAWANGRVVHHDPARAPFRVVNEAAFLEAWEKSNRWTLLLLPPAGELPRSTPLAAGSHVAEPTTPCDALVASGVKAGSDGDRRQALEILASAAALCPGSSAALREAAGVHALNENWNEARRLARQAVRRDPADAHAWRILATAAYVGNDDDEALRAWNAAGEPSLDLVSIQGLDRTRHAVVSSLLGLEPGQMLTRDRLDAARLRLRELPSAETARVSYRPVGGGLANVEAVVLERPRWPTGRMAIASTAVRLATDREVRLGAAALTGGGERIDVGWRWWERRPRLDLGFAAPSALGVWEVAAYTEKQTYGAREDVERRRGGTVALSNWTSTLTRWQLNVGVDAWPGRGRTVAFGGRLDQRMAANRLSVHGSGTLFGGGFAAWSGDVGVDWRSSTRHEGSVALARGGIEAASDGAPRALWPGAGTGHARRHLLRAHPLLDDGRITGDVFGRRVLHASGEVRRWAPPVFRIVRIAPAFFIDAAHASRRASRGDAWHVDAGVGVRITAAGSGVLRVDLAKGLRDGATQLSAGWSGGWN